MIESTMSNKHDWTKAQPHHVKTGEITTRRYAEDNPNRVAWVTVKK